jgi:hypothetical protein
MLTPHDIIALGVHRRETLLHEAELDRLARQAAVPHQPLRTALAESLRAVASWLDGTTRPAATRSLAATR